MYALIGRRAGMKNPVEVGILPCGGLLFRGGLTAFCFEGGSRSRAYATVWRLFWPFRSAPPPSRSPGFAPLGRLDLRLGIGGTEMNHGESLFEAASTTP